MRQQFPRVIRLVQLNAVALLATSCAVPASSPIAIGDFPDPFVLVDGGGYYAYATNANNKHVQVLHSKDLNVWRTLPDAMPVLASWVRPVSPDVWAPEVIKIGERFVLYYTARDRNSGHQCVGAAVASFPTGPFSDTAALPLVCQLDLGGTIDASPLLDGGRLYLYFKSDGNCCDKPTHIFAQELRPNGLEVIGKPTRLLTNGRGWEGKVIEAPTMVVRGGKYVLLYSGNDFGNGLYAAGYATCAGPVGPCEPIDIPFLASSPEAKLLGPGHQAVFQAGGQDYIAYHAWELKPDGKRGDRRLLYIDRLGWRNGKPVVLGTSLARQRPY